MSRIPFVEELGNAFDDAIAGVEPPRRPGAVAAFLAAFVAVIALGASWWALQRPVADPTAQTTTTVTTPDAADEPALPEAFAGLPDTGVFVDGDYLFLGEVLQMGGRFVALGNTTGGSAVLTSADGLTWDRRPGPGGTIGADTALVAGGTLFVGGMDAFQGPGLWREDVPGEWARLTLPSAGLAIGAVRDMAARGDGLLAVGQGFLSTEYPSPLSAVVWTGAGDEWRRIEDPSFVGTVEVDANGVATRGEHTVIAGVWGQREGEPHAVVWTSSDLDSWQRTQLPTVESLDAGSWATDVVWTGSQYVVVGGERLIDGTVGAIWTSPDGTTWARVPHDPSVFAADGRGELRLNQLARIDDGVLALGVQSAGAQSNGVVLVSSDGAAWNRIDLSGPSSAAAGAAQIDETVVVVGAADINTGALRGAVWISPIPPGLDVAAPAPELPDADEVTLVVEPDQVAPSARVKVTAHLGENPRPDGPGVIVVTGPSGEVEACSITFAPGYPPWCAFRPEDVGLVEAGSWPVHLVVGGEAVAGSEVEVVPSGTIVARLAVSYLPYFGPPVQSIYVRNLGDAPLDLTGWALDNPAGTAPYVFAPGSIVDPGSSAGLIDGPTGSSECGTMLGNVFVLCGDFSGGPDDPIVDPGMEAYSGGVVLLDANGVEVDSWSPADEG